MSHAVVPRLRADIEILPSPVEERPGVILRDSFRYTDAILLIPSPWVRALLLLDGTNTLRDIQTSLTRSQGGQLVPESVVAQFVDTLRGNGFLDSPEFHRMRERRHEEFRQSDSRNPSHSGAAYPDSAAELTEQFAEEFGIVRGKKEGPSKPDLIGIAAPHASPGGAVASYGAAYRSLNPELASKTFVILGTSHYGAPSMFGLTRKPYVTPLGRAHVDTGLLDRLIRKSGNSVELEDYCHAIEHSIEFQVVFLQHALGPGIRILPILCGPIFQQAQGPDDPKVQRFVEGLAELAASERDQIFWVLGVDMAHVGARYGDQVVAQAGQGRMNHVRTQDRARIDLICKGDAAGFAQLVQPHADQLKWCGYSPFYVFLRAMELARPGLRGNALEYEQWNIDAQSVVTFAAMEFFDSK
jgi:AmmeMemoRadiSam system protein B